MTYENTISQRDPIQNRAFGDDVKTYFTMCDWQLQRTDNPGPVTFLKVDNKVAPDYYFTNNGIYLTYMGKDTKVELAIRANKYNVQFSVYRNSDPIYSGTLLSTESFGIAINQFNFKQGDTLTLYLKDGTPLTKGRFRITYFKP